MKKNRLDSSNFFVNLITLLLLPFVANGLDLPAPTAEVSEVVFNAISSGDIAVIIGVALPNLLNPLFKLFQNGVAGWSWDFLKSANFWTQAVTAALLIFAGMGLVFPDQAATDIVDSLFTGEVIAIILAMVINVINPLIHYFKKD